MKRLLEYVPGIDLVELIRTTGQTDCHDCTVLLVDQSGSDFIAIRLPSNEINPALRINIFPGAAGRRYMIMRRDRSEPVVSIAPRFDTTADRKTALLAAISPGLTPSSQLSADDKAVRDKTLSDCHHLAQHILDRVHSLL